MSSSAKLTNLYSDISIKNHSVHFVAAVDKMVLEWVHALVKCACKRPSLHHGQHIISATFYCHNEVNRCNFSAIFNTDTNCGVIKQNQSEVGQIQF